MRLNNHLFSLLERLYSSYHEKEKERLATIIMELCKQEDNIRKKVIKLMKELLFQKIAKAPSNNDRALIEVKSTLIGNEFTIFLNEI